MLLATTCINTSLSNSSHFSLWFKTLHLLQTTISATEKEELRVYEHVAKRICGYDLRSSTRGVGSATFRSIWTARFRSQNHFHCAFHSNLRPWIGVIRPPRRAYGPGTRYRRPSDSDGLSQLFSLWRSRQTFPRWSRESQFHTPNCCLFPLLSFVVHCLTIFLWWWINFLWALLGKSIEWECVAIGTSQKAQPWCC